LRDHIKGQRQHSQTIRFSRFPIAKGDGLRLALKCTERLLKVKMKEVVTSSSALPMLAKYWAAVRANLRLHSFHAEILIASAGISIGPRSYAAIMADFFKNLANREGQG